MKTIQPRTRSSRPRPVTRRRWDAGAAALRHVTYTIYTIPCGGAIA